MASVPVQVRPPLRSPTYSSLFGGGRGPGRSTPFGGGRGPGIQIESGGGRGPGSNVPPGVTGAALFIGPGNGNAFANTGCADKANAATIGTPSNTQCRFFIRNSL